MEEKEEGRENIDKPLAATYYTSGLAYMSDKVVILHELWMKQSSFWRCPTACAWSYARGTTCVPLVIPLNGLREAEQFARQTSNPNRSRVAYTALSLWLCITANRL